MKKIVPFLLLLGMLIVFPVISFVVTHSTQDVRSKAAEEKTLPVLPPLSPFIRLGSGSDHVKKGELIPVYVSAKSNDISAVEAQIVVEYDPTQLLLEEKNIRNENVFPVLNIPFLQSGRAVISLFVDTDSGYDEIALPTEKRILTLFFSVVGNKGDAAVRLIHEGEEKTQLFTSRDINTGETPDILSSKQDVIIHID
jgi:hypothetical protein